MPTFKNKETVIYICPVRIVDYYEEYTETSGVLQITKEGTKVSGRISSVHPFMFHPTDSLDEFGDALTKCLQHTSSDEIEWFGGIKNNRYCVFKEENSYGESIVIRHNHYALHIERIYAENLEAILKLTNIESTTPQQKQKVISVPIDIINRSSYDKNQGQLIINCDDLDRPKVLFNYVDKVDGRDLTFTLADEKTSSATTTTFMEALDVCVRDNLGAARYSPDGTMELDTVYNKYVLIAEEYNIIRLTRDDARNILDFMRTTY